jgi:hypothetical protein
MSGSIDRPLADHPAHEGPLTLDGARPRTVHPLLLTQRCSRCRTSGVAHVLDGFDKAHDPRRYEDDAAT